MAWIETERHSAPADDEENARTNLPNMDAIATTTCGGIPRSDETQPEVVTKYKAAAEIANSACAMGGTKRRRTQPTLPETSAAANHRRNEAGPTADASTIRDAIVARAKRCWWKSSNIADQETRWWSSANWATSSSPRACTRQRATSIHDPMRRSNFDADQTRNLDVPAGCRNPCSTKDPSREKWRKGSPFPPAFPSTTAQDTSPRRPTTPPLSKKGTW